jgi:pimeloyl-ACP methyl ester carboxylesterase
VFESLEMRLLCAIDASSVTLTRADGDTGRSILARRETWIVIHGLGGSADAPDIRALARAVDGASWRDQVLLVDWRHLAFSTPEDGSLAEANAQATANVIARKLRQRGFKAGRINLIGFSMGALVADRIAKNLHDRGGVNRIVALDPAAPVVGTKPNGLSRRAEVDLAGDSQYALAFHGADKSSPFGTVTTADDTILIENIGTARQVKHQAVLDLFTVMTQRNDTASADPISRVFSLTRIKGGAMPTWRKDRLGAEEPGGPGYEAVLRVESPTTPHAPERLTYVNARGRVVHFP